MILYTLETSSPAFLRPAFRTEQEAKDDAAATLGQPWPALEGWGWSITRLKTRPAPIKARLTYDAASAQCGVPARTLEWRMRVKRLTLAQAMSYPARSKKKPLDNATA